MKRLFILLITVFSFGISANAQQKAAEFKFETESFNLGKIELDKPVSYTFNFTNSGDLPLIISNVAPSCGCTVGEYTQTPVKPGEKGFIKLTVHRSGSAQPFNLAVTISSNARTSTKVLYLKGETVVPSEKK